MPAADGSACARFCARESRHCCQRAGKVFRMIFRSSHRLRRSEYSMSKSNHLIESRAVLAADLPKPGQARHGIKPPPLPRLVALVFVGDAGPRPHEAHLAAHHVDELRQFIQPGGAQQGAQRNQARIAVARPAWSWELPRLHQLPEVLPMRNWSPHPPAWSGI